MRMPGSMPWARRHRLQMPTRLNLAQSIDGIKMWQANPRSPACPDGFGLEDTIAAVWRAKGTI